MSWIINPAKRDYAAFYRVANVYGYASRTISKVFRWIKSPKGTPCVPYGATSGIRAVVLTLLTYIIHRDGFLLNSFTVQRETVGYASRTMIGFKSQKIRDAYETVKVVGLRDSPQRTRSKYNIKLRVLRVLCGKYSFSLI
jgi:hypothetical protein